MANRYPLILDTTDGNKIKELPEDDNLDLRTNSIVGVQNVTALGTIDAADITVGGQRILPQSILDLTDTPSTYSGQANQVLKVNAGEDGLDFVDLADLGDLTAGNIDLTGDIIPTVTGTSNIGSISNKLNYVVANNFQGNLVDYAGSLVFDATTGEISYAAIVGAPDSLSEFTNDMGFVTLSQVSDYLADGITISDFKGSVFGDDSTLLVDGVNSRINPAAIYGEFGGEVSGSSFRTDQVINETNLLLTTDGPFLTQTIDIAPGGSTSFVNIIAPNIQILGEVINRVQLEEGADVKNGITGDLTGSVYYDDSTTIIDAVAGKVIAPTVSGNATFENDIVVQGNLTVQGTTTSVETTNTTIKDNTIVLNDGETGAGVTNLSAGIEIDRGSEANVEFIWDEGIDRWSIGARDFTASGLYSTSITGTGLGNITGYDDITGTGAGTVSGFATITGSGGGNITQFASITGTSGGTISQFTNITGDSGGTISQFTNITGDSGGTISQFTNITGDSGGDITQFTNITGDTGGTISQFTNITGDTGGTISGFATITGDSAGDITGFRNVTGTGNGNVSGFVNVTGNGTGVLSGFTAIQGDTQGYHIGDVKGSVFGDDSTLLVDAVNSRFVGTLVGDIIGDMTGDPVLTLSTPGDNPGEIINISPGGSANFVNIVADTIRFYGDTIAQEDFTVLGTLNAGTFSGTGDLKGSVFGDDSSILVDGVNNQITGVINSSDATSSITMTTGAIVMGSSGGITIEGAASAAVNLGTGTSGTVTIGHLGNTVSIPGTFNATLTGNVIGNVTGDLIGNIVATGTLDGDLTGSVFADDSTLLVDAVNGVIPGYVKIADLKTALQDGAGDYAAFKAWVLANL